MKLITVMENKVGYIYRYDRRYEVQLSALYVTTTFAQVHFVNSWGAARRRGGLRVSHLNKTCEEIRHQLIS